MTAADFFANTAAHYGITPHELRASAYMDHIRQAARARSTIAEELFPDVPVHWLRVSDFRLADFARENCNVEMALAPPAAAVGYRWSIARMDHLRRLVEAGVPCRLICQELGLRYEADRKMVYGRVACMIKSGTLGPGRIGYPRRPAGPIALRTDRRQFHNRDESGQFRRQVRAGSQTSNG